MDCFEYVKEVKGGSLSVQEHTAKVLEKIKKQNKEYHYFNTIAEKEALAQADELDKQIKSKKIDLKSSSLLGIPISAKDCICVKGIESRAGSRILTGYKPVFDATVVERSKAQGAIVIGKTAQDVFGFGTFSVNVGLGMQIPLNPHDKKRSCGGSSGGCGGVTAIADFPHLSLAESTGGSIAAPSSFCGAASITPTYGRVSRYGLMDYANSMDKIGAMGKTIKEAALLLNAVAGADEKESTSLPEVVPNYVAAADGNAKGIKIGVIKESLGEGTDTEVSKITQDKIAELEKEGAKITELSLPLNFKYGMAAYYLIATAETSTNQAKYCGMRYGAAEKLEGTFDEYFSKVRSMHFNEEAKRRIIIGTFARMAGFRDAYYLRAMKVRTKLIAEYKTAFKKVDVLASPTMPIVAPTFQEIEKLTALQHFMMDILTCPANMAGMPHISVNAGKAKKMPVGIMFTADHLNEEAGIRAGNAAEVI